MVLDVPIATAIQTVIVLALVSLLCSFLAILMSILSYLKVRSWRLAINGLPRYVILHCCACKLEEYMVLFYAFACLFCLFYLQWFQSIGTERCNSKLCYNIASMLMPYNIKHRIN